MSFWVSAYFKAIDIKLLYKLRQLPHRKHKQNLICCLLLAWLTFCTEAEFCFSVTYSTKSHRTLQEYFSEWPTPEIDFQWSWSLFSYEATSLRRCHHNIFPPYLLCNQLSFTSHMKISCLEHCMHSLLL